MNRITISGPLKTELDGLFAPVELVDESGVALGHFVPRLAAMTGDDCPYSAEELQRMRAEQGGRTLADIRQSWDAK